MKQENKKIIQWHPAFYSGLQIDLQEEADYNVPYKVDTISERDCLNGYLPLGEINYYC